MSLGDGSETACWQRALKQGLEVQNDVRRYSVDPATSHFKISLVSRTHSRFLAFMNW